MRSSVCWFWSLTCCSFGTMGSRMQNHLLFLSLGVLFLHPLCSDGKQVSVKEVVFDSAVSDIQWLGADQKTVLVQTSKGRLYRSTTGGDKWNDISDQLRFDDS